jgi:conjugative transfer signal peptidase TraF
MGFYWIASAAPTKGELAVIRLPRSMSALAAGRGYLAQAALLIKPVAANRGDLVCRRQAQLTINGQAVAHAKAADALGRPLPGWAGCRYLTAGQIVVLSAAPHSFDSRYFGPIEPSHIIGAAHQLWRATLPVRFGI